MGTTSSFGFGTYGYIAVKNLRCAQLAFVGGEYDGCAFMCHQAVEKIMKHVLVDYVDKGIDCSVFKANRLIKILNVLCIEYPSLNRLRRDISRLGDVYFNSRYPSEKYTEYTKTSAAEFLNTAVAVFTALQQPTMQVTDIVYASHKEAVRR